MSKVRLDLYSREDYEQHPFLKRFFWYLVSYVFFKSFIPYPYSLKRLLLRIFGAKIGLKVVIKPQVQIKFPWKLEIGDYSWIGERVWIDNLEEVKIGAHCCVSQGAMLLCGNHNYKSEQFNLMMSPIVINDGAWIGAKTLVGPGTVIGQNAVITFGLKAPTRVEENKILWNEIRYNTKDRFGKNE